MPERDVHGNARIGLRCSLRLFDQSCGPLEILGGLQCLADGRGTKNEIGTLKADLFGGRHGVAGFGQLVAAKVLEREHQLRHGVVRPGFGDPRADKIHGGFAKDAIPETLKILSAALS